MWKSYIVPILNSRDGTLLATTDVAAKGPLHEKIVSFVASSLNETFSVCMSKVKVR